MPRKSTTDSPLNFQTVRLGRGSHVSPEHGACVMELASMLAGEAFTDHPRSVSPMIAAFLRAYNDLVDDERRHDLFKYAADCVGTRASRATERLRAESLPPETDATLGARVTRRLSLPGRRRAARASTAAVELSRTPSRHADALALLDRLIAMGARPPEVVRDATAQTHSARAWSRS